MMTENVHSILLGGMHVLHSVVFYWIVLENWCYYSLHALCCANLEVWDFSHGLQLLFKKSSHWILHIYTDMHIHHTQWPEYSKTYTSHQIVIWLNKNIISVKLRPYFHYGQFGFNCWENKSLMAPKAPSSRKVHSSQKVAPDRWELPTLDSE